METERKHVADRHFIFIAVISLTVLLRLLGLQAASLTLNEADEALTALRLFSGETSSQLLYSLPTALIFRLFGDSDFTARLFPALMGVLLSIVPLFFCSRIGERKAVLLTLLLAADPILLFWSKRADAVIPAVALAACAIALFLHKHYLPAVLCFLFALCGGPRFIPWLIVAGIWTIGCCVVQKKGPIGSAFGQITKRTAGIALVLFAVFITVFGMFPAGISAFGLGLAKSFMMQDQWVYPGIGALLIANILYCGIPWLLFIYYCIRRHDIFLLLSVFIAAVFLLVWQGVMALPWVSVTLLPFAADVISEWILWLHKDHSSPFWIAAAAIVGSYSFLYFRLVEVFNQTNGSDAVQITWNGSVQTLPLTRVGASVLLTIVGVVIIILIVKLLLGFFDSEAVQSGIFCGCLIICSWALVQNIWSNAGFDRIGDHPAVSHLQNSLSLPGGNYTAFTDSALFEILDETIAKHGDQKNPDYGLNLIRDDALLDWTLRSNKGIRKTGNIASGVNRAELILDNSGESFQEYGFAGTVQAYRSTVYWNRFSLMNWGKWMLFGDGPVSVEAPVTIWVKGEMIFSGEE